MALLGVLLKPGFGELGDSKSMLFRGVRFGYDSDGREDSTSTPFLGVQL